MNERPMIYLIGSLRNPVIPHFAVALEERTGYEVFADWAAASENADDAWRDYIRVREPKGGIVAALNSYAAKHVFNFDKHHIDRADAVVLLMPAGKSGFLELGYSLGKGKPGFIVFDKDPDRYDVMMLFATGVATSIESLVPLLKTAIDGPEKADPVMRAIDIG